LVENFGDELKTWEGWIAAITTRKNWVYDHYMWFSSQTRAEAVKLRCGSFLFGDMKNLLEEIGISVDLEEPQQKQNVSTNRPEVKLSQFRTIFDQNEALYRKLGFDLLPKNNDS
jgi:hypothetical protein